MPDAQWPQGEHRLGSWDELLDTLKRWGSPQYLYRGQGRADWKLTCTLARALRDVAGSGGLDPALLESYVADKALDQQVEGMERKLLETFMDEAQQLHLPDLPPPYDRLAWWELMQHHGAPTRLLDWTRSPFIALWFALNDPCRKPGGDMTLWILNIRYSWLSQQELLAKLKEQGHGWTQLLDLREWQNRLAKAVLPAKENEHSGVVVGGDGRPSTTERPKSSRSQVEVVAQLPANARGRDQATNARAPIGFGLARAGPD